jgi:ankyrin repeat protein
MHLRWKIFIGISFLLLLAILYIYPFDGRVCAAVNSNQKFRLKLLLVLGANPNENLHHNLNGIFWPGNTTPLHIAATKYNDEIVKILLDFKADPDIKNLEGRTPLFIASGWNSPEVLLGMIHCGANINVSDNHQMTPLHFASSHNRTENVIILLKNGADKEAKDVYGRKAVDLTNNPKLRDLLIFWDALNKSKTGETKEQNPNDLVPVPE